MPLKARKDLYITQIMHDYYLNKLSGVARTDVYLQKIFRPMRAVGGAHYEGVYLAVLMNYGG